MKKRQWSIRRSTTEAPDAQRRWDRAYQQLLQWKRSNRAALPQKSPITRRITMNIAVYVRVSTQRQAQAQTIEQQLDSLQNIS